MRYTKNTLSFDSVQLREDIVESDPNEKNYGIKLHALSGNPELLAAVGASLSRNPSPLKARLKSLSPEVKKRIMDKYFKRYGHNSIGDIGHFAISFEGVSMLAAYLILNNRLFDGQEASTRYIGFAGKYCFPKIFQTEVEEELCRSWFSLYERVFHHSMEHCIKSGYSNDAAEAASFDIAGGLLPIATRTSVFFVGSIRTFLKQLYYIESMEDEVCELRELGEKLRALLLEVCPNSVSLKKSGSIEAQREMTLTPSFDAVDRILRVGLDSYLHHGWSVSVTPIQKNYLMNKVKEGMSSLFRNTATLGIKEVHTKLILVAMSDQVFHLFRESHRFSSLEDIVDAVAKDTATALLGNISVSFKMDFRSLRDLHRHRIFPINQVRRFGGAIDCNPWYQEKVRDVKLKQEMIDLFSKTLETYSVQKKQEKGYISRPVGILPMMSQFPAIISGSLHDWYSMLMTRKSGKVHPVVHTFVQDVSQIINHGLRFDLIQDIPQTVNYEKRSSDK